MFTELRLLPGAVLMTLLRFTVLRLRLTDGDEPLLPRFTVLRLRLTDEDEPLLRFTVLRLRLTDEDEPLLPRFTVERVPETLPERPVARGVPLPTVAERVRAELPPDPVTVLRVRFCWPDGIE